jgi:hypothetical protein
MANLNGYPEQCDVCGLKRTCNDAGLCHECQQADNERCTIVDENGEEWTPGGFAL